MKAARAMQCQLELLDDIRVGRAQPAPFPFHKRLMLTVSLHMNPRLKRFLRPYYLRLFYGSGTAKASVPGMVAAQSALIEPVLAAGERVRVRAEEEIVATLDQWGKLKGCRFMPEMRPYCGTEQTVLKPLERFFDEREYALKKAKGLVLLKDVMCQGVDLSGRCDRSCFFFWRVEWLEKIDGHAPPSRYAK
jgi:hypothetical protein